MDTMRATMIHPPMSPNSRLRYSTEWMKGKGLRRTTVRARPLTSMTATRSRKATNRISKMLEPGDAAMIAMNSPGSMKSDLVKKPTIAPTNSMNRPIRSNNDRSLASRSVPLRDPVPSAGGQRGRRRASRLRCAHRSAGVQVPASRLPRRHELPLRPSPRCDLPHGEPGRPTMPPERALRGPGQGFCVRCLPLAASSGRRS